jgi:DNA-binding XRE family transcriptional regulator
MLNRKIQQRGTAMANNKGTRYEDFEAELLERPGVRREYEALRPKYEMIRSLIERRNQLRISQKQLADLIGTKQPAISRLEKGDCNTSLGTFFKVTNALDLDICIQSRTKAEQIRGKVTT